MHKRKLIMHKFSETQKKIAMLLSNGQMNIKSISSALQILPEDAEKELEGLKALKLAGEEDGSYFLEGALAEQLAKRKEIASKDQFDLKIRAIIELQSIEESLLERQANELKKAIEKEKNLTIYEIVIEKPEKIDEYYSTYIEATLSIRNFQTLINFMFFYGPSAVEVIKPEKLEINAFDLSEGLIDMADMIHKYTEYITRIMSKKDLEKFTKAIYAKKTTNDEKKP